MFIAHGDLCRICAAHVPARCGACGRVFNFVAASWQFVSMSLCWLEMEARRWGGGDTLK
jgi:hypothetical protein